MKQVNTPNTPVVAIDGPSGAGKGTITQMLAKQLGWHLLDSGALYRLTALAADRQQVDLADVDGLARVAASLDVRFMPSAAGEPVKVLLADVDVTRDIRTETAGERASQVAVVPQVRAALLQRQRDFQQLPGLVADGRDMGTVVFPDAPVKIFLTASAEERAARRHRQLMLSGVDVKISDLLNEIKARDDRDMHRAEAPLRPADDAVMLDTTGLSIDEVLQKVLDTLQKQRLIV